MLNPLDMICRIATAITTPPTLPDVYKRQAGITQNPSKFNPVTGQKANSDKQKVILQDMVEQGYISKEEQEEALADDVYSRIQDVEIVTKETSTPYSYFTDELVEQVQDAMKEKLGYTNTRCV